MNKFEYYIRYLSGDVNEIEQELDRLGEMGWKLVCMEWFTRPLSRNEGGWVMVTLQREF